MALNVRNCRKCGKIFNYVQGPPICQSCAQKLEEDFQRVKEYIRSNPAATLASTAEDCEIEVNQIKQWVREERLAFSSAEGSGIVCEKCGKPIISGRFCDECKNSVTRDLRESIKRPEIPKPQKKPERESDKMRFLNRNS